MYKYIASTLRFHTRSHTHTQTRTKVYGDRSGTKFTSSQICDADLVGGWIHKDWRRKREIVIMRRRKTTITNTFFFITGIFVGGKYICNLVLTPIADTFEYMASFISIFTVEWLQVKRIQTVQR